MRLLRSFLTASATTRSSDASPRPSPQPNAEDMKDTRTLGSDSSTSIKPTLKVVVPPRKFFDAVEAQDTKISFGQKIMAVANKKFAGLPDLVDQLLVLKRNNSDDYIGSRDVHI